MSRSATCLRPARNHGEQLLEDVNTVYGTADLVIRLLELHPLSPKPPLDVAGSMPSQMSDHSIQEDSKRQQCKAANASTQGQPSQQQATWPTPKPAEWHDIELVAESACVSLGWALSLTNLHHIPAETVHRLIAILCQLIQHLVAGHLPDLDLDMQKLFKLGMHPVLQLVQHAQIEEGTNLAVAMLSRMAIDSSLIPQSLTHAVQILSIFSELTQAKR